MSQPHHYDRRILLCATGMSPQIVTETLYALALKREPAFVPTEVHLISTADGLERARLMLLSESRGHFHRLCRDYGLPPIAFDDAHLHGIRGDDGAVLPDIRTPDDNAAAADAISRLVAALTRDESAALHVSIAGGRKTMGYYLGYALSLFGREQDRLSHVLVAPEYESLSDFFYPTPEQAILINQRNQQPLDAARATVDLAEIPFVRLRDDLPESSLSGAGFVDAVRAAESSRTPARLHVLLQDRAIECNGHRVELSPQSFVFYAWIAERCWDEVEPGGIVAMTEFNDPGNTLRRGLQGFGQRVFANEYAPGYEHWRMWNPDDYSGPGNDWIYQRFNDVNKRLESALGRRGARPFLLVSERIRGTRRGYRLALAPEQIDIVE